MSETAQRDRSFDIVKGIAILAVVTHHVLSNTTKKIAVPYSWSWWCMEMANRCVRFAVPTFLFLSALLVCRSLAKENPIHFRNYYTKRLKGTVAPYLIWTFLYLLGVTLFESALGKNLTGLGLTDIQNNPTTLLKVLLLGKAAFHLYFLAVLIQAQIVLPFISLLARKSNRFLIWIFAVFALQISVYIIYYVFRETLQPLFPTTGSAILWYLIPVGTGIWIGTHWVLWQSVWSKLKFVIALIVLLAFATYLTLESAILLKKYWVNTIVLQSSVAIWATGSGILLLQFCKSNCDSWKPSRWLSEFGQYSLGIFLIHPAIIFLIDSNKIWPIFDKLPLTQLWVWLSVFCISYAITKVIFKLKLNPILFGR